MPGQSRVNPVNNLFVCFLIVFARPQTNVRRVEWVLLRITWMEWNRCHCGCMLSYADQTSVPATLVCKSCRLWRCCFANLPVVKKLARSCPAWANSDREIHAPPPENRRSTFGVQNSMPNMTRRPGHRRMEMNGGSSASYLACTPRIPLFCTLFHRGGNRGAFRPPGAGGGSCPLYGGTFARSCSVSKNWGWCVLCLFLRFRQFTHHPPKNTTWWGMSFVGMVRVWRPPISQLTKIE